MNQVNNNIKKERIHSLYTEVYEIESKSQSKRIIELHKQNKGCVVNLGITDPKRTQYLFVLYNPGGDVRIYNYNQKQDTINASVVEHISNYWCMQDYLNRNERLARGIKVFIKTFAKKSKIDYQECVNDFGQVNTSFYPSPSAQEKDLDAVDYYIETEESFGVLKKELELKNLRSLIFSGPSFDYFFHKIYKPGAEIEFHRHSKDVRRAFTTILFNNKEVLCVFIKHLSYVNDPTAVAEAFYRLLYN